jgi:hypothetical protein
MKNEYDDTISKLKGKIAALEAEAIDLKKAVNVLCKASGTPEQFSDDELGVRGFRGLASLKPAQFYGKTPMVSAREYLDMRPDEPVEVEEIMEALKRGGFDFEAQGWTNETMRLKNLSISLGKNSQIFHRLPNGMIGLTKWYSHIKKKANKGAEKDADTSEADTDLGQPAEETAVAETRADESSDQESGAEEIADAAEA